MKKCIEIIPTTKAVTEPAKRDHNIPVEAPKSTSISFFAPEPRSIGTDKRKLNLVASSRESPANNPPEIVDPDRETPGTIASV
jgi:hypothetical protein